MGLSFQKKKKKRFIFPSPCDQLNTSDPYKFQFNNNKNNNNNNNNYQDQAPKQTTPPSDRIRDPRDPGFRPRATEHFNIFFKVLWRKKNKPGLPRTKRKNPRPYSSPKRHPSVYQVHYTELIVSHQGLIRNAHRPLPGQAWTRSKRE